MATNSTPRYIRFSDEELGKDTPTPETVRESVLQFVRNGTLFIENAFPPALVHSLHEEFERRYKDYFTEVDTLDALSVGNRRKMITVRVEGPFNNPRIYANPLIMPIIKGILGTSPILNGYGSVVALPGAKIQHKHRDYAGLFQNDRIDSRIPTFAITVIIPLVPIDETVGGTRVWLGSHMATDAEIDNLEFHDPVIPLGSCMFMDYTLAHRGQANASDRNRPIMYNIYSKAWFRDDTNYLKQKSLDIPDEEYRRVPDPLKPLFSWSKLSSGGTDEAISPESPCVCGSGLKYSQCHGRMIE